MQKYISQSQYRALGNPRRKLSKNDEARLEKGLEPIESEERAQEKVIKYLEFIMQEIPGKIIKFTAIPNNTRTPYESVKKKQITQWLRAGLLDIFIVYNDGGKKHKNLWVEMKKEKVGRASQEQKAWAKILNETEGTTAEFAWGYDQAKEIIDKYIF